MNPKDLKVLKEILNRHHKDHKKLSKKLQENEKQHKIFVEELKKNKKEHDELKARIARIEIILRRKNLN